MPTYQRVAFDVSTLNLNENLLPNEKAPLLSDFQEVFAKPPYKQRCVNVIEHYIRTGDKILINQPLRRFALWQRDEIAKQIADMMEKGIISPCSNTERVSNVTLARKRDGYVRFCVDYKNLNEQMESDPYPLPCIDDCLDALKDCQYFTGLDLASRYWQVRMAKGSQSKTAFRTPDGIFMFLVMPLGLRCAPSTFSRLMDEVFGDLKYKSLILYLNDVEIFSETFDEHLLRLRAVIERLKAANLRFEPSKCHFAKSESRFCFTSSTKMERDQILKTLEPLRIFPQQQTSKRYVRS